MRIELELALIVSSVSVSPEQEPAPRRRLSVNKGGGKGQLDFCTGIEFTPDLQLSANQFGAFVHARQAVMSGLPISGQDLGVNPFSVVTYPHAKLPLAIPDLHFNLPRVCVPE